MWTLGIDVAKRSHRATLLGQDGQTVFRNLAVQHSREGVELLRQRLTETGQSPAGIDVKQIDSGDQVGCGRMSKRGSRYLRTAVMQASEIAVFKSHDPLFVQVYQRQIDRGKHHLVALTHVANKMLHVVFSVLKNNRPYTPILN